MFRILLPFCSSRAGPCRQTFGGRMQLFAVPAVGGTPQQLTHRSGNLLHPRVSPSGILIAATRVVHRKEIWRVALPH